jgi:hypothetical protein
VRRLVLLTGLAACASFESEEIVIDMRVLAMSATVPDQILDVDLQDPPELLELLDQLVPTTVCSLVADPTVDQRLRYSLTLCSTNEDQRCIDTPHVLLAEGVIEDPDTAIPAPALCATINPDGNLAGILLEVLEEDDVLNGLGGLDYGVALRVGGESADRDDDLFAAKTLRVAPRIPATRTANANPPETPFTAALDGVNPQPLPMGRCVDQTAPLVLVPTQRARLEPVEPAGAREDYVLPTLDGQGERFTESLTYQWLAASGSLSAWSTGGPRNAATGDPAPLFSDFRAPAAEDLTGTTDIPLWIVQRDERLGSRAYETCIRVVVD